MINTNESLTFFTLFILFNALCAGIYSIIPISGFGVVSYIFLFLLLFYLECENGFYLQKSRYSFICTFLWLTILLIWKQKGTISGLYSWFLGGLVFFLFSYIYKSPKKISIFIYITLIIALLFALFEMLTGIHLPLSRFVKGSYNLKSFFGLNIPCFYFTNENDFSAYLILAFCFLRSVRYNEKKILDLFILPVLLLILFVAGARLCLIGLFIYYLYFFFMKLERRIRLVGSICISFVSLFLFIKVFLPYITNLQNIQSTKSIVIRTNLFLLSLKNIFIEKNYIGLGPASFPTIVDLDAGTGTIIDPHNWFMELGVEAGVFFLILYLLFIVLYFKYEFYKPYKAFFIVFLICNFCSSRFCGILWNWFFLSFFIYRFYFLRNNKTQESIHAHNLSSTITTR